eukprot:UN27108
MEDGEICEADKELPDGNKEYEINNCPGSSVYDVFRYTDGNDNLTTSLTPSSFGTLYVPTIHSEGYFVPVLSEDCPCSKTDFGGCKELP